MSKKTIVTPGDRFNRCVIICEIAPRISPDGQIRRTVLCECDCGNTVNAILSELKSGHTKSCGCYKRYVTKMRSLKHGQSKKTPEYNTWLNIKKRCYNVNSPDFPDYGARGITVCDSWRNSFENFFEDMGKRPTKTHSIERKNNNLCYSPENCIWATSIQQANNKRNNRIVTYNGQSGSVKYWSAITGINKQTLATRTLRGWCETCAITIQTRSGRCSHRINQPYLQEP
jgi:hypothetical protein